MNLRNKVGLVTGAANGIGYAIAERLLDEGMVIVAMDVDGDGLDRMVESLDIDRQCVETVVGDVSHRADVHAAVVKAVERFQALDVVAANAGIAVGQSFLEIDDATWDRILAVNLNGTFYTIQEAARVMTMQGRGSIVVTSSTNGFYVETNLAHYNASKGGIDALVRSAAIELAWHGIRVNAIAPSMVKTRAAFVTQESGGSQDYLRRVPMSRFADPSEIAAAVAFLGSDESSFMTGQSIVLDGGLTLGIDIPLPPQEP